MLIGTRPRLPAQPTLLVGRTNELAIVYQQLAGGDTRLLTLTGPAGVGKTHLALAAAAQLADHFRDGIVFVDLSPVHEPELVLRSIAGAIGLPDTSNRSLVKRLQHALGERQILLVLDNFEHVLPAAACLADFLAMSATPCMLVTSRVPLQLRWERTLRIAPLPVPDLAMPLPPLDELTAIPSIALFLYQVRARQADFILSENLARLVARLVVQLDGLPLALELAAARTATLSLPAIANRLGDRLRLLRWQALDLPMRQQSLEAAVGWSYDLLSEAERRVLRSLGVFVQRVALDAITAVYGEVTGEAGEGSSGSTLDRLVSLAEQSLIQPAPPVDQGWQQGWSDDDEPDDETDPAFGMFETVREYAEERLAAVGELETARGAHAAYFLALAERGDGHLHNHAQRMWLLRLEHEHDNLQAALRWLLDQETPAGRAAALRLAGALGNFWELRGYHAEGVHWLEEALSHAPQGEEADMAARMRALLLAGSLRACLGEHNQARGHLEEALGLARQLQGSTGIMQTLSYLGVCPLLAGQALAVPLLEEALVQARTLGEPDHVGIALFYLGVALRTQGHADQAAADFDEALDQLEAAGDVHMAGSVHVHLGVLLDQRGDRHGALQHLRAALVTSARLRSRWLLSLSVWAILALLGGRADLGWRARLLGATEALRHAIGAGRSAWEQMAADLGEPEMGEPHTQEEWAAYREGSTLPAGEVAALALGMLDEFARTLSSSAPTTTGTEMPRRLGRAQVARQDVESQGGHLLSERECEVLQMVEQGLSNKVIGQHLFISSRTVSQHLTSVFNKLGVNTRAQAVAVAVHHGLV